MDSWLFASLSCGCSEVGTGAQPLVPISLLAMVTAMAMDQLIANGSFGPDEIGVMKAAYVAALIDVGVTDRDDPITELIAKSIVNVTATGERNPKEVMERALNEAFVALLQRYPRPTAR